jgi:hypothetical protein
MKAPYTLTTALAALMVFQSVLGLVFQEQYRDVEWIKATWFGNDWVTLVVAVPLLVIALLMARRGSVRALFSWLGLVVRRIQLRLLSTWGCPQRVLPPLCRGVRAIRGHTDRRIVTS